MSIRFGAFFLISSLCSGGRRGPAGWRRRAASSAAAQARGALAPPAFPPSPALEINFLAPSSLLLWCLCTVTLPQDVGLAPLPCHCWPMLALAMSFKLGPRWPHPGMEGSCVPPRGCWPCPPPGDGWGRSYGCSPAASFSLISPGGWGGGVIPSINNPPMHALPTSCSPAWD